MLAEKRLMLRKKRTLVIQKTADGANRRLVMRKKELTLRNKPLMFQKKEPMRSKEGRLML